MFNNVHIENKNEKNGIDAFGDKFYLFKNVLVIQKM